MSRVIWMVAYGILGLLAMSPLPSKFQLIQSSLSWEMFWHIQEPHCSRQNLLTPLWLSQLLEHWEMCTPSDTLVCMCVGINSRLKRPYWKRLLYLKTVFISEEAKQLDRQHTLKPAGRSDNSVKERHSAGPQVPSLSIFVWDATARAFRGHITSPQAKERGWLQHIHVDSLGQCFSNLTSL